MRRAIGILEANLAQLRSRVAYLRQSMEDEVTRIMQTLPGAATERLPVT